MDFTENYVSFNINISRLCVYTHFLNIINKKHIWNDPHSAKFHSILVYILGKVKCTESPRFQKVKRRECPYNKKLS